MNIKDKPVVNRERQGKEFTQDVAWPEGTPDEVIEYMNSLKVEFHFVEDLTIESDWSGYEDCFFQVKGTKFETDEEMNNRITWEEELLKEWEEEYIVWMETTGKKKAAREQAKLDEQLRQFNLLKEKLEKAGKLPIDK